MNQPFWTHYPKKFWVEADWQAWEKAGRPRVPPHLDLQPPPRQEMGMTLPGGPPGPAGRGGLPLVLDAGPTRSGQCSIAGG